MDNPTPKRKRERRQCADRRASTHRDRRTDGVQHLPPAGRAPEWNGSRTLIAVCEVWSHQLGWELRLTTDGYGLETSAICRSANALHTTIERWRAGISQRAGADLSAPEGIDRPQKKAGQM